MSATGAPLSWQSLFEALPDGSAILDGHGVIRHVNSLLLSLTGYERDELEGSNVEILVPTRHRSMEFIARSEYARDPSTRIVWSDRDLSVLRKNGSELPIDFALTPIEFEGHHWAVASIRDNSEKKRAENALIEAELQFRLSFEDNMAPMIITDNNDLAVRVNDAFCELVGRSREELLGRDSKAFTHPDDVGITESNFRQIVNEGHPHTRYIKRYLHSDGHLIYAEVSRSAVVDDAGQVRYFIISERDITEERELTERLSYQALHDPLTKLANRALFENRLDQTISRMQRSGGSFSLLLIDLDDFKAVNDAFGHLIGDGLLQEVAGRLQAVTRDADTLCRFGGDEFIYLAEESPGTNDSQVVAQRLMSALEAPFEVGGVTLIQRASIGVAHWDSANLDRSDVIRHADIALYEAKQRGKHKFFVFDDDLSSR